MDSEVVKLVKDPGRLTVELTENEVRIILGALNGASVQGIEAMRLVLRLADELRMLLQAEGAD